MYATFGILLHVSQDILLILHLFIINNVSIWTAR